MTGPAEPTEPSLGDAWVYESLVTGIPGLRLTATQAVAVQFLLFESLVVGLGLGYGLPAAAVAAGTVAVAVAAAGSVAMLHVAAATRRLDLPATHRRLLFGSGVEVLFGVLGFVATVTYLLASAAAPAPLASLLGRNPPAPVLFVTLLILWDLCYRVGTSWWTALVSLWRSLRLTLDAETVRRCRRLDATNVGFALLELALLPVVRGDALLAGALVGHVVAVAAVSTAAILLYDGVTRPEAA